MNRADKDMVIYVLMIGTFLTTYASIRGAAAVAEEAQDFINNPVSHATDFIKRNTPGVVNKAAEVIKEIF